MRNVRLGIVASGILACSSNGGSDAEDEPTAVRAALGEQLSLPAMMTLAHEAGVPCDRLVLTGAVAMAESEGWPLAIHYNEAEPACPNGSRDRGIWQINDCWWPAWDDACAFDPACNARAMAAISGNGASFEHWTSYSRDGRYAQFLDDAEAGYASVPACGDGSSASSGAECDELGYHGICMGAVAIWSDLGTCWVRDCAGEGKTCGLLSASEGWGCLEGPAGSTKLDCGELGYTGACYGDVLVWAEGGSCRFVDCAETGRRCSFEGGSVGFDCR